MFERTAWPVGVIKTKTVLAHTRILKSVSCFVFPVSAVAQQILWNCLIEDPALVLRHFLEKLTVSNRQVGTTRRRSAVSDVVNLNTQGVQTR